MSGDMRRLPKQLADDRKAAPSDDAAWLTAALAIVRVEIREMPAPRSPQILLTWPAGAWPDLRSFHRREMLRDATRRMLEGRT